MRIWRSLQQTISTVTITSKDALIEPLRCLLTPHSCPRHCQVTIGPGDRVREWTVPTVSASVASKTKKISLRSKDNPVNTALVSELKLRLEQKNMANRY